MVSHHDSYVEQAVRTRPDTAYYFKIFFSIFFIVFGTAGFLFLGPIGLLMIVIGGCLFYYFSGDSKMEYEYTLTNGSVEIAAIYNASRRKEKKHFSLEQVSMVVPKDSPRISNERFVKTYDFTSKRHPEAVIAMVLDEADKKQLILMEPNEKTMTHIRNYAKNKVYSE